MSALDTIDMSDGIELDAFQPGLVPDMPESEYRQVEAVSGTACKLLLRSPMHYRWAMENPKEQTPAMATGTAFHLALLEPDRYALEYTTVPEDAPGRPTDRQRNAKKPSDDTLAAIAFWDEFDAEVGARTVITVEQANQIDAMVAQVRRHAGAMRLLEAGAAEVSLFWRDARDGVKCKGRLDWLRPDGVVVDVKTCRNAEAGKFGRDAADMGYLIQAAHYWSGLEHVQNESPKAWAWLCVENEPPYGVACYVLDAAGLRVGMAQQGRALRAYKQCTESGYWPGYSELIEPARIPSWALKEAV